MSCFRMFEGRGSSVLVALFLSSAHVHADAFKILPDKVELVERDETLTQHRDGMRQGDSFGMVFDTRTEAQLLDDLQNDSLGMFDDPRMDKSKDITSSPSGTRILGAFQSCKITKPKPKHDGSDIFTLSIFNGSLNVHVFKNAGTTINRLLRDHGGTVYSIFQGEKEKEKTRLNGAVMSKLINNPRAFRTALVRDPLDRVMSVYHEVTKREYCNFDDLSTDTLQCKGGPRTDKELVEDLRRNLMIAKDGEDLNWHYYSQASFLADDSGMKLPLDYIGQLQKLEEEVAMIYQLPQDALHVNHGPGGDTTLFRFDRQNIPDDVKQLVCDLYRDDYCCFDFAIPDACDAKRLKCQPHY